tara:strand:- start:352 stop:495 length:144 start_codon:yes stop_codon:yes gene_type:complete
MIHSVDRQLLKEIYGLSHKEQSKAWRIMKKMNITIDQAAKNVIKDRK